ncbi:MAG: CBS domain-containing protein [Pseudomonadota bacterium]
MIIEQILKTKGDEVTTVPDTATLQDTAKILDEARIGAIVALDGGGEVCGVLSERDIVRQMARNGNAALSMKVSDSMTRDVITAAPTDTLEASLSLMTDRRIRHLPVVRDGSLIGIVSIGDLVKWKIAETEAEAESLKSYLAS